MRLTPVYALSIFCARKWLFGIFHSKIIASVSLFTVDMTIVIQGKAVSLGRVEVSRFVTRKVCRVVLLA